MPSVDKFNRLPQDAARQALRDCCSSGRWIDVMTSGRPYAGLEQLLAASDAAVTALREADLREALAGHPRIGDLRIAAGQPAAAGSNPVDPGPSGWSRQEQAGVGAAGADMVSALASGNEEYERRFGHIYLACATGRSAADLLDFLRKRLGNDRETEWGVVAAELAKINQIRLRKLTCGAG